MGRPADPARRPHPAVRRNWRVTLFAVLFGGAWLALFREQWGSAGALFWIDAALGAVSVGAVQFRRRRPVAVAVLTTGATAFSASAFGAWAVCQASLATRRRWREILPVAALGVLTGQVLYAVQPEQPLSWVWNLVFSALVTGVVVAVGMYVGARRELLTSLRDRAERAEREQALQVVTARTAERARIAREMHDVLAHRMSLVALHAGALAYRTDLSADQTRETAGVIQANSQRALADLREILGLLRDPERGVDATGHRPQPTLGDLSALLADERAAGAHVTLHASVEDLDELPGSTGRSAYRIVQEALTNARKHAPYAAVTVELTGGPGRGLDLCVRNPVGVGGRGGSEGAGFGLVGLAERAAAGHGRLEHGRTADGDFVLHAWLPWDR
ncbi:Signal transduction histidine kinase [Geodermatophilus dictyosporus]|uniref:histidine kinase n=1 Tax=Geodermatophilus dictyosporus TaxID=1523247 RepID=A0A1I5JPJ9_9ACTN|nr:histidine kinase [Geodermatophilus dictyosporus]SFO74266.1 Signal transduction histidine kinase [Geodermatophilus dictyosporus]